MVKKSICSCSAAVIFGNPRGPDDTASRRIISETHSRVCIEGVARDMWEYVTRMIGMSRFGWRRYISRI